MYTCNNMYFQKISIDTFPMEGIFSKILFPPLGKFPPHFHTPENFSTFFGVSIGPFHDIFLTLHAINMNVISTI